MSSSVNEFQAFMINDSQLKSTAQVNLFTINSDKYGGIQIKGPIHYLVILGVYQLRETMQKSLVH